MESIPTILWAYNIQYLQNIITFPISTAKQPPVYNPITTFVYSPTRRQTEIEKCVKNVEKLKLMILIGKLTGSVSVNDNNRRKRNKWKEEQKYTDTQERERKRVS